jgi:hypothetical protein
VYEVGDLSAAKIGTADLIDAVELAIGSKRHVAAAGPQSPGAAGPRYPGAGGPAYPGYPRGGAPEMSGGTSIVHLGNLLIVRASLPEHDQIESLLAKLRAKLQAAAAHGLNGLEQNRPDKEVGKAQSPVKESD